MGNGKKFARKIRIWWWLLWKQREKSKKKRNEKNNKWTNEFSICAATATAAAVVETFACVPFHFAIRSTVSRFFLSVAILSALYTYLYPIRRMSHTFVFICAQHFSWRVQTNRNSVFILFLTIFDERKSRPEHRHFSIQCGRAQAVRASYLVQIRENIVASDDPT